MHFNNFDICEEGRWAKKTCDPGMLFWQVPNCCIPINKYPTTDNCALTEEERRKHAAYQRSMENHTPSPCDKNKTLIEGLIEKLKQEGGVQTIPQKPDKIPR